MLMVGAYDYNTILPDSCIGCARIPLHSATRVRGNEIEILVDLYGEYSMHPQGQIRLKLLFHASDGSTAPAPERPDGSNVNDLMAQYNAAQTNCPRCSALLYYPLNAPMFRCSNCQALINREADGNFQYAVPEAGAMGMGYDPYWDDDDYAYGYRPGYYGRRPYYRDRGYGRWPSHEMLMRIPPIFDVLD
jgi:LSD1 subclass zinc finger protein